jgi:hypothetical protein
VQLGDLLRRIQFAETIDELGADLDALSGIALDLIEVQRPLQLGVEGIEARVLGRDQSFNLVGVIAQ